MAPPAITLSALAKQPFSRQASIPKKQGDFQSGAAELQ
jgi:hypothetical protein